MVSTWPASTRMVKPARWLATAVAGASTRKVDQGLSRQSVTASPAGVTLAQDSVGSPVGAISSVNNRYWKCGTATGLTPLTWAG